MIPDSWAEGQWASEGLDGYVGDIRIFHDSTPEYQVPVAAGEGGSYVVTAGDGLGEPETLGEVLLPVLAGVWLAGVLGMLGYSLFAWLRLRRRLAEAVPLQDRIFLCDGIPAPFVMGIFRPAIYLPSDLTEKEQEYVLLHENGHIRRRDPAWKALGYLAFGEGNPKARIRRLSRWA